MTAASPAFAADSQFAHSSYGGDPAFEPHPGFGFDENEADVRAMQQNIASMNVFHGEHSAGTNSQMPSDHSSPFIFGQNDPFPVGTDAFTPSMTSSIDPATMWGEGNPEQPNGFTNMLPSLQTNMVGNRGASVAQKYGQITPPDDSPRKLGDRKSSTGSVVSNKKSPLDKSARARNAANKRHEKNKQDRKASLAIGDEDSDGSVDGKREQYREKNRVAAAKCRAKKKENVEGLEERHRDLAAQNKWLRAQERALRDELSFVRTQALQHTPHTEGCQCQGLHNYNARKAVELATGMAPASSPSSYGSPAAVDAFGRHQSQPDTSQHHYMMMDQQFPRAASFAAPMPQPSNFAFTTPTTPEDMKGMTATSGGDDQQNFSSFLQSSHDGRPGFS